MRSFLVVCLVFAFLVSVRGNPILGHLLFGKKGGGGGFEGGHGHHGGGSSAAAAAASSAASGHDVHSQAVASSFSIGDFSASFASSSSGNGGGGHGKKFFDYDY